MRRSLHSAVPFMARSGHAAIAVKNLVPHGLHVTSRPIECIQASEGKISPPLRLAGVGLPPD
jgi:hypothetical protein